LTKKDSIFVVKRKVVDPKTFDQKSWS